MEKLGYSCYIHNSHVFRLWFGNVLRPDTIDCSGTFTLICFFIWKLQNHILFLFKQTICVQVKCFQEIISIGYSVYRIHRLPWFRSLSWYMLIASNYFLFGERIIEVFTKVFKKNVCISNLVCSFCKLYLIFMNFNTFHSISSLL